MELGDISKIMNDKNADAIKVPDLDWLMLTKEDTKNIPTPHNVEIIPELQEMWGNTDKASARLIANTQRAEPRPSTKLSSEHINDVVNTAKKEMMLGTIGKELSSKLASLYTPAMINAAKDKLTKLAEEQGLLGHVYIDLSPFDSCDQAAKVLGKNRIRLAKYVTGKPKRKVCATHNDGKCKALDKKVAKEIEYDESMLKAYDTHMKVAGMMPADQKISSKEELRNVILAAIRPEEREASIEIPKVEAERPIEASVKDISDFLVDRSDLNQKDEYTELRPILSFMQEQMMSGKIGDSLKEAVYNKVPTETLKKYANEIKKVAALQGLLGNVYVDVSYFDGVEEAVKAIKNANTNPTYLIQTEKKHEFDDRLNKVAAATGCEILPRDGKISADVAGSYIDDLQYQNRVSGETAKNARNMIASGGNVLKVLRDVFMASTDYKRPERSGGQEGYYYHSEGKKYAQDNSKIKTAATEALNKGFSVERVENKIAEQLPMVESVAIVRDILANADEIDAGVLTDCTKGVYQIKRTARLKKASKCDTCVRATCEGCTVLGLRFASFNENPGIEFELDPKTEKVMLAENPDVVRENLNKEFDMPSVAGQNINVDLEKMRSFEALEAIEAIDVDLSKSDQGFDEVIKNM